MNDARLRKLNQRLDQRLEDKRREHFEGQPCPECGQLPKLQIKESEDQVCGECSRRMSILYPDQVNTIIMPMPMPNGYPDHMP